MRLHIIPAVRCGLHDSALRSHRARVITCRYRTDLECVPLRNQGQGAFMILESSGGVPCCLSIHRCPSSSDLPHKNARVTPGHTTLFDRPPPGRGSAQRVLAGAADGGGGLQAGRRAAGWKSSPSTNGTPEQLGDRHADGGLPGADTPRTSTIGGPWKATPLRRTPRMLAGAGERGW